MFTERFHTSSKLAKSQMSVSVRVEGKHGGYVFIKRSRLLANDKTWMNLQNTILREMGHKIHLLHFPINGKLKSR